jgi:hypothetical protein
VFINIWGLFIDSGLSFNDHVKAVRKKVNKRLYFVRTMVKLNVEPNIVALFFNSTITPVLNYAFLAFHSLIPQYCKNELDKPRKICKRLTRNSYALTENSDDYKQRARKQAIKILNDKSHPLHSEYTLLPSGKRYRVVKARTERHRLSYLPVSTRLLNAN